MDPTRPAIALYYCLYEARKKLVAGTLKKALARATNKGLAVRAGSAVATATGSDKYPGAGIDPAGSTCPEFGGPETGTNRGFLGNCFAAGSGNCRLRVESV